MFVWLRSFARIPPTLFGLILCFASYVLRLSLPKTKGTLAIPGLRGKVEVIRDSWGVPHIFAQSNHDLFFALGFVHAQDRMWQMEFSRRAASGTLAEVLGKEALDADRFMRRLGLWRSASSQIGKVSAGSRKILEAYSEGVNEYLNHRPRWRLPIEFILLRFRPKPWSIVDSAAISKLIGWVIAPNWDSEIVRMWLVEKLGHARAKMIEPIYPKDARVTVPCDPSHKFAGESFLREYREATRFIPQGGASNTWAIDGTKSVNGKPLLACDPHLPASMPSFWYEAHLSSPNMNVIGASIPGLPAVIIGHNKYVAWGISSGLVDQKDVYLETLNPDNKEEYFYEGEWRKGEHVTECITVRGRNNPVYEDILITHHGPLMSPVVTSGERAFSIRSVEAESLGPLEAGYELMAAANWSDFRKALRHWSSPSMNFTYADIEGNIGYQLAGLVPIRGERSGRLPADGSRARDEWKGFIPFKDLPSVFNPPTHFIAAANNKPSRGTAYGPIQGEWADPYRIQRITDLLGVEQMFSADDLRNIQGDVYSLSARELIRAIPEVHFEEKKLEKMFQGLRSWDYRITSDSANAALYEVFAYRLYRNFFAQTLGGLLEFYMGKGIHEMAHINALGFRASSNLVRFLRKLPRDWPFGEGVTLEDIIRKSFKEAIGYLRSTLGKDERRWQWGKIHGVTFPHILGRKRLLHWIFNKGPYPLGGDANTIPQASYDPVEPYNCMASIVSYRQIIDLSDLATSWAVNSTGNSGQPGSKHFGDQIPLWLSLKLHPMLFNKKDIREHAEGTLALKPAPPS